MTLTSIAVVCGLSAKATPTGTLNTSKPTLGSSSTHSPAGNVIYTGKVTSVATSNVATLTVATGDLASTTGSPTLEGGSVDFQGTDLGTSTKIHAIRLRTSGTGTITIGGSSSSLLPALVLQSGSDMVLKFPTAGATLSGTETLTATFSAAGGILEVEALTQV